MTLYVDSSAFVKRHSPEEHLHADCVQHMSRHSEWYTSRLTCVEAPRALRHRHSDRAVSVVTAVDSELSESVLVEIDHGVVTLARAIAFETGIKTLDALHLASAKRVPDPDLEFLTYDERQAAAAEQLGLRLAR